MKSLKKFDIFGEPIGINYQGESSYTTVCGTIISISLGILVIVVGTIGVLQVMTYEDINVIQYTSFEPASEDIELDFGLNEGAFVFGLFNPRR